MAQVHPTDTGGSAAEITSETTVADNKATTTVTDKAVTASIAAAADAREKTLIIKADANGKDAPSTTVSVPKASVQKIAEAGLNLTMESADGARVTLTPETMTSIADQAAGGTLEINITTETQKAAEDIIAAASGLDSKDVNLDTALVVSVTVNSGGKAITSFGGKMSIDLPADSGKYTVGESYKVYQINADGSVEVITGTCVKVDGVVFVRVSVSHLSTFVVTNDKTFAGYDDVSLSDWFYDAVAYVTEYGLMNGTGETTFAPNSNMTRAMLVTVLYRLEGEPSVTASNPFTDVAAGQWYTDAILWASGNKIVEGYGSGLFGTNDNVTREQMAAILYRYAASKSYDVSKTTNLSVYTDAASISDWAKTAMQWANAQGLITGRTTTTLVPTGTATRAEVASILMRFVKRGS